MAKKVRETSAEDRLAAALVPANEQPYQVPGNWVWTHGSAIFRSMESKKPSGESFSYIDIDSVDNKRQIVSQPKKILVTNAPSRASRRLHPGDTIFSLVRPYLKNIAYIDNSLADAIASTGFFVCSPRDCVRPKFGYHMMTSKYVVDGLNNFMKGDNSPSIRADDLLIFPYPLPPLPEQRRIVERIESLFAKLDEAKDEAQAVIDGYEDRKAVILHRAFTGELTEEWRCNQRIKSDTWKTVMLETICKSIFDGDHMPPPKAESGIPFLVISNVNKGVLSFDDTRYVSKEYYNSLTVTRKPSLGDVLYTLVGSFGIPVLIDTDRQFCFQRHMGLLKPTGDIISRFLWYELQTQEFFQKATGIATGTAQMTIPIKGLRKLEIKLPTLPEQHEIVRRLDALLTAEAEIKSEAEATLENIATLKQSILARAFRGELGTNDTADEPAIELLKRTLEGEQ